MATMVLGRYLQGIFLCFAFAIEMTHNCKNMFRKEVTILMLVLLSIIVMIKQCTQLIFNQSVAHAMISKDWD